MQWGKKDGQQQQQPPANVIDRVDEVFSLFLRPPPPCVWNSRMKEAVSAHVGNEREKTAAMTVTRGCVIIITFWALLTANVFLVFPNLVELKEIEIRLCTTCLTRVEQVKHII